MGEGIGDKVEGKLDEFGGKAKQVAGDVTGDDQLKAEGKANEAEGKAEGFLGKVKDFAGDAVDTAKGLADKAGEKIHEVTSGSSAHTHEDGTTHTH